MTPAKSEKRLTKEELRAAEALEREEAIKALRQWRVMVGKVVHYVTAHSSALASGGVLMFYTHTEDGLACRNLFRVWTTCEEIVCDGSKSESLNN